MATARLTIRVEKDGLSAFVAIARGSPVNRDALDAELRACGVIAGIETETYDAVARGLMDPDFACDEVLIARGREVRQGRDASLELAFAEGIQAGHIRQDGTLDYHERDLLKPVEPGELLGTLRASVPGSPGLKVDGTPIEPNPTYDLPVELRSGVVIDADGLIRAARRGVVLYIREKALDIVEHHVHKGPVDLHSGNLRMNGSLLVQGDVKHPFTVGASGNLQIQGSVEGSSVRAGGALRVQGGVRGAEGAAVHADGDIAIVHAESAELSSAASIRIQEAVNCQVRAVTIQVSGRIRGGHAIAEDRIIAKEAGAQSGVATRLTAGEPLALPVEEAQYRINALKAERMAARAGGRTSDRCKGGKVGRVKAELDAEHVQRLAERVRRRETLVKTAWVHVGLAHPGVTVYLGPTHTIVTETTRSSRYSFDEETSSIRVEKVT